ncbi:MAG: hypothetical protein ACRCZH_03810 [Cetobacterium sp.]
MEIIKKSYDLIIKTSLLIVFLVLVLIGILQMLFYITVPFRIALHIPTLLSEEKYIQLSIILFSIIFIIRFFYRLNKEYKEYKQKEDLKHKQFLKKIEESKKEFMQEAGFKTVEELDKFMDKCYEDSLNSNKKVVGE